MSFIHFITFITSISLHSWGEYFMKIYWNICSNFYFNSYVVKYKIEWIGWRKDGKREKEINSLCNFRSPLCGVESVRNIQNMDVSPANHCLKLIFGSNLISFILEKLLKHFKIRRQYYWQQFFFIISTNWKNCAHLQIFNTTLHVSAQ